MAYASSKNIKIDKVKLGKTGLVVPRLALGTGSHGGNQSSDMTRMGLENWVKMARYAHERGMTFYDAADLYGSHRNVKEILKNGILIHLRKRSTGSEQKQVQTILTFCCCIV